MTGSHEVIGSIPIYSTEEGRHNGPFLIARGISSFGRAVGSQSTGNGFDSRILHTKKEAPKGASSLFHEGTDIQSAKHLR